MKQFIVLQLILACFSLDSTAATRKALIIDGQNNHDWKATTPILKAILQEQGLFEVEIATAPAQSADLPSFKPDFARFDVVVSNYNGAPWSQATQDALVDFVRKGGGFVSVHAANNSFPEWKEYNRMIGVGGWGGRGEKSGPYVRFIDGKVVKDPAPGHGGSHGAQHDFVMEIRDPGHPITAGLPERWLHVKDELYDRLRGPAENLTVLATAFANPAKGGSGFHEPLLMTIAYGQGRVFHTALGHGVDAMRCVGFATTLRRGAEWAATGKVEQTRKLPDDFPTAEKTSSREY